MKQSGLSGIVNGAAWDIPGILIYADSTDPRVVVGGGSTAPTNSAGAASAALTLEFTEVAL